jgi:hypothetical protein
MAVVLLPLLLGLAWGGLGPTRAAAQEGTEGAAFLSAFRDAWVTGAVERVLPLFAPEAVVILTREDPESPEEYRGDTTPAPLRAGVAALLRSGAQLDLAGAQTGAKGAMVDGVPTTFVRWTYQHPGAGLPVPPEIGTDELVLRAGRILTYTRTPEGANQRARARALDRHIASLALDFAHARFDGRKRVTGAPDGGQGGPFGHLRRDAAPVSMVSEGGMAPAAAIRVINLAMCEIQA